MAHQIPTLERSMMFFARCLAIAALTASLAALPVCVAADDTPDAKASAAKTTDKSTDKPTDKSTEKPAPAEVTTQGDVVVGGQHIAYTAIAGTLTVGATDAQDAQLGLDGKPQADSQLLLDAPKEAKDAPATARMFYVAYFKK